MRDISKFSGEPLAHAGKSILEYLWEMMDATYADLMENPDKKKLQGRAGGIAEALALMSNPYLRDVEAVRNAAHERWEAVQEGAVAPHHYPLG
jgi:hypothetical protein